MIKPKVACDFSLIEPGDRVWDVETEIWHDVQEVMESSFIVGYHARMEVDKADGRLSPYKNKTDGTRQRRKAQRFFWSKPVVIKQTRPKREKLKGKGWVVLWKTPNGHSLQWKHPIVMGDYIYRSREEAEKSTRYQSTEQVAIIFITWETIKNW